MSDPERRNPTPNKLVQFGHNQEKVGAIPLEVALGTLFEEPPEDPKKGKRYSEMFEAYAKQLTGPSSYSINKESVNIVFGSANEGGNVYVDIKRSRFLTRGGGTMPIISELPLVDCPIIKPQRIIQLNDIGGLEIVLGMHPDYVDDKECMVPAILSVIHKAGA